MAFDLKGILSDGIGDEIKEMVQDAIEKCKKDPSILSSLKDDPVGTLKKLGISVDKDMIEKVVDMIKAGVAADKADDAMDKIGDVAGKLKGLFGK